MADSTPDGVLIRKAATMARITTAEQALIPNVDKLISAELVRRLSQDELSDRIHAVAELMAKAQAATDPTIRRGFSTVAATMLRSPESREEIEKHYGDLMTKAALSPSRVDAARLRDQAQQYLDDNPVAPRRQERIRSMLRKAAADGQVAVYDEDGNLVGVISADKITPLAPLKAPAAKTEPKAAPASQQTPATSTTAPAANTPDEVTKAVRSVLIRRHI